ncbi:MAG TPA: class II glutamine amidotransferase [Polyangia bacterium]|nr:class II glutamine amidotransferase [Polyangia bacterium]
MCELMGMECNVPTDIVFSFTGFALRGGKTGPHADGWGLALYDGKYARSFLEPAPACASPMAAFIRDNPIKTLLAVAHVRKKTRGRASLENTHPFKRTLWGRHWVFAHNGTLPHVRRHKLTSELPVGETDSEHAFCWILEQLRAAFPGGYPRDARRLWTTIAELGGVLGAEGKFNFLLADGRHLYARCGTQLCYIARRAPFGRATLRDAELQIDFSAFTTTRDRVAVVATTPLTRDETWHEGRPGTMWVFRGGQLRATLPSLAQDAAPAAKAPRKRVVKPVLARRAA